MHFPGHLKKSVVFLGVKENGRFKPRATGFVVSVDEGGFTFLYVVTAEHVVEQARRTGKQLWMRNNLKSGGTTEIEIAPECWKFHPRKAEAATDVAIAVLGLEPNDDIRALPLKGATSWAATPEVIEAQKIGIGEETVIVGLFRSHHGEEKNIPIVRIGNIAAMDEEPIFTRFCGFTDAYLIEARSIGGLSGSPVFVNMPPIRTFEGQRSFATGNTSYLLGLVHGHFDVQNMSEDVVVDDEGGGTSINTGVGIVIPVTKIIESLFDLSQLL